MMKTKKVSILMSQVLGLPVIYMFTDDSDNKEVKIIEEQQESLSDFLYAFGRKTYVTQADGSCLFRAFSHQLFDSEDQHRFIRLLLQRFENLNKKVFSPFLMELNEKTIEAHIRKLDFPSVWGTHIEMLLTSRLQFL